MNSNLMQTCQQSLVTNVTPTSFNKERKAAKTAKNDSGNEYPASTRLEQMTVKTTLWMVVSTISLSGLMLFFWLSSNWSYAWISWTGIIFATLAALTLCGTLTVVSVVRKLSLCDR